MCVYVCVCKHLQPTTVPCLHINQLNSFRKLTTQITVVTCDSVGIAIFWLIIPQKIKITLGVICRYTPVFFTLQFHGHFHSLHTLPCLQNESMRNRR